MSGCPDMNLRTRVVFSIAQILMYKGNPPAAAVSGIAPCNAVCDVETTRIPKDLRIEWR